MNGKEPCSDIERTNCTIPGSSYSRGIKNGIQHFGGVFFKERSTTLHSPFLMKSSSYLEQTVAPAVILPKAACRPLVRCITSAPSRTIVRTQHSASSSCEDQHRQVRKHQAHANVATMILLVASPVDPVPGILGQASL
eukprot:3653267-Pleurochrysis_carterae.AAC.7